MRRLKKKISLLFATIVSLSVFGGNVVGVTPIKAAANVNNPRTADDGTVTWDKIQFGSYPQDAEFEKEPIKWRILDIDDDGNAFLLADEALDCRPYNYGGTDNTWETSSMRSWLNGTGDYEEDAEAFINAAFSTEEQGEIIETEITNDNNPSYDTAGGNNTRDKVYLLSISEASNNEYGFNPELTEVSWARQAKPTDYSYYNGAIRFDASIYAGNCYWWLRSPGSNSVNAAVVSYFNKIDVDGSGVFDDRFAVRPVLHVNLSSSYVMSAGTVSSNGDISLDKDPDSYEKPRTTESGVTTWDCVWFGNYKQKASFYKKPIEWRVLSVNGNDAFVMAENALDCMPYNGTLADVTWETCTLRSWLNATGDYNEDADAFINAAFSEEEKSAIIEADVVNDNNSEYGTAGGNNTRDMVYLLSCLEASKKEYGFDTKFDEESETRQAKVTDYAFLNGVYRGDRNGFYSKCYWWLRSPGSERDFAAIVLYGGKGDNGGYYVANDHYAVRPVLHVNITSSYVTTAGTVSEKRKGEINSSEETNASIVDSLIDAIGTVTKDSKDKIDAARKAYNELSEGEKYKVTKLIVLVDAEKAYEGLVNGDNVGNSEENDRNSNDIDKNENKGDNITSPTQQTTTQTQTTQDTTELTQQAITPATTEAPVQQTVAILDKVKIVTAKNIKKGSFTVSWKKVKNATGYELQYALNKKFSKGRKSAVLNKLSFSKKKLKKGKKYYIRIRAYAEDAGNNKVYGSWSSVKSVKIKR